MCIRDSLTALRPKIVILRHHQQVTAVQFILPKQNRIPDSLIINIRPFIGTADHNRLDVYKRQVFAYKPNEYLTKRKTVAIKETTSSRNRSSKGTLYHKIKIGRASCRERVYVLV